MIKQNIHTLWGYKDLRFMVKHYRVLSKQAHLPEKEFAMVLRKYSANVKYKSWEHSKANFEWIAAHWKEGIRLNNRKIFKEHADKPAMLIAH